MPARVLEQVGEHLTQPVRVAVDGQIVRYLDRELARGVDQRGHREPASPQSGGAALEPREVEQLVDEVAQAPRLDEQLARIGRRDAVGGVLEHRLQRADRGP